MLVKHFFIAGCRDIYHSTLFAIGNIRNYQLAEINASRRFALEVIVLCIIHIDIVLICWVIADYQRLDFGHAVFIGQGLSHAFHTTNRCGEFIRFIGGNIFFGKNLRIVKTYFPKQKDIHIG